MACPHPPEELIGIYGGGSQRLADRRLCALCGLTLYLPAREADSQRRQQAPRRDWPPGEPGGRRSREAAEPTSPGRDVQIKAATATSR